MAEADRQTVEDTPTQQAAETTDGFHLVIDALKLNDINTIFGLVGIPITDLARLAQAEGMRFIGFRHEQHAGNAAAISRLHDAEAGYLPDRVGAGLSQRPDRARQRDHQLLPDDPDQRLERARNRRSAARRLRRNGSVECGQAVCEGRVSRAACGRHRHRRGACDPCRGVGPPGRRVSGLAGQAARANAGRREGAAVAGQSGRCRAASVAGAGIGQACDRCAEERRSVR